jgi:hypothetical protein
MPDPQRKPLNDLTRAVMSRQTPDIQRQWSIHQTARLIRPGICHHERLRIIRGLWRDYLSGLDQDPAAGTIAVEVLALISRDSKISPWVRLGASQLVIQIHGHYLKILLAEFLTLNPCLTNTTEK